MTISIRFCYQHLSASSANSWAGKGTPKQHWSNTKTKATAFCILFLWSRNPGLFLCSCAGKYSILLQKLRRTEATRWSRARSRQGWFGHGWRWCQMAFVRKAMATHHAAHMCNGKQAMPVTAAGQLQLPQMQLHLGMKKWNCPKAVSRRPDMARRFKRLQDDEGRKT